MGTSVTIVKGNLLKSDCDVIVQQANCFAKMGAGIAKQIVTKYPGVAKVDRDYPIPVGSKDRLGNYSEYNASDGVTVVNMYSQYHWGRGQLQTDYKAMEEAFKKILSEVTGTKVGLPYQIGSGLAGGDWKIVYGILERISNELGREIYIYKL